MLQDEKPDWQLLNPMQTWGTDLFYLLFRIFLEKYQIWQLSEVHSESTICAWRTSFAHVRVRFVSTVDRRRPIVDDVVPVLDATGHDVIFLWRFFIGRI